MARRKRGICLCTKFTRNSAPFYPLQLIVVLCFELRKQSNKFVVVWSLAYTLCVQNCIHPGQISRLEVHLVNTVDCDFSYQGVIH